MDYRNAAKKELEEYSKLMQTEYAWLQEQAKRKKGAASGNLQRVPLGEAAAEGKSEENDGKEAETLPDEWVETGLINTPQLRYRAYEQAVPVLSLETAKTALVSIEELGCIKDRIPDCIVVYLDDEGNRWIRSFASLQDARKVTEEYGMVSDKDVEDALEKNKELNTVFSDEDCRVVHKRNTRGYYSSEGDVYRIPDDCEGIAISYRDGQFRLCQFLDMDVLEEMCTVYLQREKFLYVDLIAESSVAIREVWATPDKNKIVAAVKKMARAESEFVVPLSENTWIDVNGEFDLRRLQTGHYTKGKRSLGKKEELNLAHLLKCMEAVEESNVF